VIVFGAFGAIEFEADVAFDDRWGLSLGKLALALVLVAFSAAGTVFYPGLLDRIVGVERGHNERQSMGTILRTLPYGRLVLAEVMLFAVTGIGLALFFVPGIIAFTFFGLVGPCITIEDRSAIGAFLRSARLVRPHFWLVLLLVTVPIGIEHVLEDLVHHAVEHEAFIVRFVSHGLIGIVIGSIVGLVEVHLAFRLSGRYREDPRPRVTLRQRATRRGAQ
jgi:hypothetical protein